MSRIEKLVEKFRTKPESVRFSDIEHILLHLGFEHILAKGSHVKFKHHSLRMDIIIPVHNNNCKPFYKKQARDQIKTLLP